MLLIRPRSVAPTATKDRSIMTQTITFGEWLKHRRKELDYTQDQLARLADCSPATIRKIEAGDRRPSRQIAELLAEHLEVAPHEREAFFRLARLGDHPQPLPGVQPPEPVNDRSSTPIPTPDPRPLTPN